MVQRVRAHLAQHTIQLRKGSNNEIHFQPEGDKDGSGLIMLQRAMPADYSVQMRLWLMQTRNLTRSLGTILTDISNMLPGGSADTSGASLGGSSKWLYPEKIANQGIGGIGSALSKISDKNMGFVNMDEHFDADIIKDGERDYHNTLSTGFAEIGWTWKVETTPST